MTTHLEQELEDIKKKILEMADIAVESINNSVDSLRRLDSALAKNVIENDEILDRMEMEMDEECVRLLVTRQPAATHLRLVLAILKMNTDIERIGDFASIIARQTLAFDGKPFMKPLVDIPRMASIAVEMINDAMRSMTAMDSAMARKVIERDREIDELNDQIYRELFSFMAENPKNISQSLGLITVAKSIERVGDHVKNIAERIIYFVDGIDVRHSD